MKHTPMTWRLCALLALILVGCAHAPEQPPARDTALIKVAGNEIPRFTDDLDMDSLLRALEQSRQYAERLPPDTMFQFGPDRYPASHMLASMDRLAALLRSRPPKDALRESIIQEFAVYRSVGDKGRVLFTGYYEPLVEVSAEPGERFRYPIYRKPDDLIQVDLNAFQLDCGKSSVTGRVQKKKVVPYYSRAEIESKAALAQKGLEIAWAENLLDTFFLQVQGSGVLRFTDGSYMRVRYDGQNGLPYKSVGKLLIEENKIPREGMSMQAIRAYLTEHPEDAPRVLNSNPSYVFFRAAEDGPYGNIGAILTPGRSIATDHRLFPKGAIVYIASKEPLADWRGDVAGWKPYARFAFNQDTGGAIRGPGRVDVFWGNGAFAQAAAGYSKEPGELFFLILKKPARQQG